MAGAGISGAAPMLHAICGKIAAGKSTLAASLGAADGAIVVSEDRWLAQLYPGEQNTLADYVRNAARLRAAIAPLLIAMLRAGMVVVLDFPANTPASRTWFRTIADAAGVPLRVHYLDMPDDVCLTRLHRRNAEGAHEFVVSDEQYALFTSHFVPPAPEEGLDVLHYRDGVPQSG